jgi:hypothetical protein
MVACLVNLEATGNQGLVANCKVELRPESMMLYCENIRNGYLHDGELVFVILKGIYSFKFPKRFLEISSRDLTSSLLLSSFVNPNHLKT